MIWWILGSIFYLVVSGLFMYVITKLKMDISKRKHYANHPERMRKEFGSVWSDLFCSLLWPFQIIGLLVYGMKG